MISETIDVVEIAETGDLVLRIRGNGSPSYQYVYRAAAGVYWDNEMHLFRFSPKDDEYAKWFGHILNVTRSEMNLELTLSKNAAWENVPAVVREEIESHST